MAQCLVTQAGIDILLHGGCHWGWRASHAAWVELAAICDRGVECREPAYSPPAVISPQISGGHITMTLVPELEEFARAIGDGRAPAITDTDGRRVLQVLDAVVAADRRGSSIKIE